MVGTGPVKDQLVRAAEARGLSNIVFRTSPFEEMPQLMSITTASLVVLRPLEISRKMRLSKAIPPMACAVPVIYAGWGETSELMRESRSGLPCDREIRTKCARAITNLADDATLAKEWDTRACSSPNASFRGHSWYRIGLRQLQLC